MFELRDPLERRWVREARKQATVAAIDRGGFEDQSSSLRRPRALPGGRNTRAYILFMEKKRPLQSIPDDELLRRLADLMRQSRRVESDLVAHIGELCCGRSYVA